MGAVIIIFVVNPVLTVLCVVAPVFDANCINILEENKTTGRKCGKEPLEFVIASDTRDMQEV